MLFQNFRSYVRTRVRGILLDLCRAWGIPSPYFDGAPAAVELDDINAGMTDLGVPTHDGDWPLSPSQRFNALRSEVRALRGGSARNAPLPARVALSRALLQWPYMPVALTARDAALRFAQAVGGSVLDRGDAPYVVEVCRADDEETYSVGYWFREGDTVGWDHHWFAEVATLRRFVAREERNAQDANPTADGDHAGPDPLSVPFVRA